MTFRFLFFLALLFCFDYCSAQTAAGTIHQPQTGPGSRLPQTLLWRISGKDGHHVSYLYGTMHLTDERVFNLGDSLYSAIHNSEGFAMEVDPAYMTAYVIDEIKKEIKNARNIRDVLSEKDYKEYGPLLEKKLGKPLTKITSEDILRAKNKWMEDSYRHGTMPTFLDTWLFDIARRQNKWTGGVEDVDDQRGLVDDVVDESDVRDLVAESHGGTQHSTLQQMIAIYARQDLTGIDSMANHGDTVLVRRNRKMAMRMDSLSGIRSMVFAVGAAHLPGAQGLIRLLRNKGFDVQPVFSAHRTKAADYVVPELPISWKDVSDNGGFYQVSMPGQPGDLEMYGLVQMKVCVDFFDGISYMTTALPSAFDPDKTDSLMKAFAGNIFHKSDKQETVPFSLGDAKGRIITSRGEEGYKKVLMAYKDGIFYAAMVFATKESPHSTDNMNRFIKSFRLLEKKYVVPDSLVMVPYVDTVLGYRVATPGAARKFEDAPVRKGLDSRAYISYDIKNGNIFLFGVNRIDPGRFIDNDSVYFSGIKKTLADKFESVSVDSSWYEQDRLVFEFGGRAKGLDKMMTTRYITRGNRWYALVAIYPLSGQTPQVRQFFSSFSLLDYPKHIWGSFGAPDSSFATWAPYPVLTEKPNSADAASVDRKYNSFDSLHTLNYFVVNYHLKPWYWVDSDSLFWHYRIQDHLGKTDSLIYKKPVTNGQEKGWEWMQRQKGSHLFQRHRVLLNGDKLWSLLVSGTREEVTTADCDRFFADFRLSGAPEPNSYLTPKAGLLVRDLHDADSARAAEAYSYFTKLSWRKEDAGLLKQALLTAPPEGWKGDDDKIKDAIVRKLAIIKDSTLFDFAADNYKKVVASGTPASGTPASQHIKNRMLRLMASRRDSAHFAAMADLLRESPPGTLLDWSFLTRLTDSLQLCAVAVPRLLPLLHDSLVRPSILYPVAKIIDSGFLALRELEPYRSELLRYAAVRQQEVMAADDGSAGMNDDDLIRLLGHFNDGQSNALLKKFAKSKDTELRLMAVRRLLWNKQAVDAAVLQSLASDRTSRLRLYSYLKDADRLSLFPPAFRTQKAFGESLVYREVNDDDMEAGPVAFLAVRSGQTKKGLRKFLFYTFKADSADSLYLACVGPWEQDPSRLGDADVPVKLDFESSFFPAEAEQRINALLKKAIRAVDEPEDTNN